MSHTQTNKPEKEIGADCNYYQICDFVDVCKDKLTESKAEDWANEMLSLASKADLYRVKKEFLIYVLKYLEDRLPITDISTIAEESIRDATFYITAHALNTTNMRLKANEIVDKFNTIVSFARSRARSISTACYAVQMFDGPFMDIARVLKEAVSCLYSVQIEKKIKPTDDFEQAIWQQFADKLLEIMKESQ